VRLRPPFERADYGDGELYARAMAAHLPTSADDIDPFIGLPGPYGAVLSSAWGTHAEREAEVRAEVCAEAQARWSLFIDKKPTRASSFSTGTAQPGSTLLSEAEAGELFTASEFAREKALPLDLSVTLCPKLLGATTVDDAEALLGGYLRNLKQCLRDNGLPCGFIGAVENSASVGLHVHLALHAPLASRPRLKRWHEKFLRREATRRGVDFDSDAVRFNRHSRHHPLLQDMLVSYVLKGADHRIVVQPASASLDGRDVLLRDLVAHAFADPGMVPFDRLIIGPALAKTARGDWRSAWERGARRVDALFSPQFVKFMHRSCGVAPMPSRTEASALRACGDAMFAAIDAAAGSLDPAVEATVANVETFAHAVDRLALDFECFLDAGFGAPQRQALDALRRSMRHAHCLADEAGGRAVTIALSGALPGPLAGRVARALKGAEERVRALATRLGEPAVPARWVLQLTCARLARI